MGISKFSRDSPIHGKLVIGRIQQGSARRYNLREKEVFSKNVQAIIR